MSKRVCWIGCVGLLVGLLIVVSGCGSQKITPKYARRHLNPELTSMAHMSEQLKNRHARTHDTNLRQIWDDLAAILLLEHPVRLSEYPIP